MGKPIGLEDVILETLPKGIKDLRQDIQGLQTDFKNMAKAGKEATANIKFGDPKATEQLGKQKKAVSELTDAQKKLIQADKALAIAEDDLNKEIQETRLRTQEKNKAVKEEIRITSKVTNEYQKQSAILNKLKNDYKNLAVSNKGTTKEAKALLRQIDKLDKSLVKVDARVNQHNRTIGKYGNAMQGATKLMGALGLVGGISLAIDAFKGIINITKGFEKTMSSVQAITGASAGEFDLLEANAKRLGKTTSFTASQVGELEVEFAKLGFSTKEILNATEATLQLAKVSGVDLAEAATVAGSTVRGFGLDANETQRIVDVMAKSFTSTALDMSKFSTAMAIVAPVAKNAGVSIEEATGFLGTLADAGVDAGTSGAALRNIFLDTAKMGISTKEAFDQIAQSSNKNATAMALFGKRGATVASILADNQEKAQGLTDKFNDSAGAAAAMAAIMEDNLEGDLKRLSSAFEGLILGEGGGFNDFIRSTVQVLTNLLNNLDPVILVFEELFGLIGELAGEFFGLLQELGLVNEETDAAGGFMEVLAVAMRFATFGIRIMVKGLTFMVKALRSVKDTIKPVVDSIVDLSSGLLDKLAPALGFLGFKAKEVEKGNKDLKVSTEDLTKTTDEETEAVDKSATAYERSTDRKKKEKTATQQLNDEIGKLKKTLDDQALAGDINNKTLREYTDLTSKAAQAQGALKQEIKETTEGLDIEGLSLDDVKGNFEGITIAMQDIVQVVDQIDTDKESLVSQLLGDEEALEAIKDKAFDLINQIADFAISASQRQTNEKLSILDQELQDELVAKGFAEAQVLDEEAMIRLKFEEKKKVIKQEQAEKEKKATIALALIDGIAAVIKAGALTPLGIATGIFNAAQIGLMLATPIPEFADGVVDLQGGVKGKDSIHALLMPGESVVTTNATQKYAPELEAMNEGTYMMMQAQKEDFIKKREQKNMTTSMMHMINMMKAGDNDDKILRALKANKDVNLKNADYLADRIGDRVNSHNKFIKHISG